MARYRSEFAQAGAPRFSPLVIETLGGIGAQAREFLRDASRVMAPPDAGNMRAGADLREDSVKPDEARVRLGYRLSYCVQAAIAKTFEKCFPLPGGLAAGVGVSP